MSTGSRPVFRSDALRQYAASRDKAVLLHVIRPRLFGLLWGVLALLLVIVGWLCTTHVPVYGTGVAVVVARQGVDPTSESELALAVFFSVEQAPQLASGQQVYIRWNPAQEHRLVALKSAPPELLSPSDAQRQFGLQGAATVAITQPSHVGIAPFEPPDAKVPAASYLGSVAPCQTAVGSQSALSLLPFLGTSAD